jgi:SpoVK/Ycf46/Vps4 family AAA+-type ATPase
MPSTETLSSLFKALASKDLRAAEEIANQIATAEEQKGHRTAAQLLRGSLVPNGTSANNSPFSTGKAQSPPFLIGALSRRSAQVQLKDVTLRHVARVQFEELALEFQSRDRLGPLGIRRRSKVILHGPPGCGKSLSALAFANEVRLPLYVVRFDSVIGAYLGQTALHLRQLFQFAEATDCVLLFDEIDALGKRRGSPTDVGELDRIVIALMQELELSELKGYVIATSNMPDSLDLALWRRFDLAVQIAAPTKREIIRFSKDKAQAFGLNLSKGVMSRIELLKNYAEVERAVEDEARRQALKGL